MQKGIDYVGIAVIYFCHDGKGNVLMNKRGINCRDEHHTWDIGGGGLDLGDTILETLQKEIKEEYSTDVIDYEFLGYRDVQREFDDKKTYWVMLDFKVFVDAEKAKNGESHKFDAVEWFTLETLPKPLFSQLPTFLKKYKGKLK